MTRDEYRAKCVEAMMEGYDRCMPGGAPEMDDALGIEEMKRRMVTVFDALNGIARIVPIEATAEMIMTAIYEDESLITYKIAEAFDAMSAAGDLTNPPDDNGIRPHPVFQGKP